MALVPDSSSFVFGVNQALSSATRAVASFLSPAPYTPEHTLLNDTLRDARLAPKAPMDHSALDIGLMAQLSNMGIKRCRQVTEASHPELMQAWKTMSQRAGYEVPPQLIIGESDVANAFTASPNEVIVTTGLLKILDLRETCAVLGHELGHATSEHTKPRVLWTAALGGLGGVAGNEFGRHGGANTLLHAVGQKIPFVEKLRGLVYPKIYEKKASSLLGYSAYVGIAAGAGALVARNISVRSTELDADEKGAAISGDPLALAAALRTQVSQSQRGPFMNKLAHWRAGYPSVEKRVANLERMAREQALQPALTQPQAAPGLAEGMEPAPASPRFAVNSIASAERVGETPGPAIT